jgi:hypothetical protein
MQQEDPCSGESFDLPVASWARERCDHMKLRCRVSQRPEDRGNGSADGVGAHGTWLQIQLNLKGRLTT